MVSYTCRKCTMCALVSSGKFPSGKAVPQVPQHPIQVPQHPIQPPKASHAGHKNNKTVNNKECRKPGSITLLGGVVETTVEATPGTEPRGKYLQGAHNECAA